MSRLDIPRRPASIAPSAFFEEFVKTERPVILENVPMAADLGAFLARKDYLDQVVDGEAAPNFERKKNRIDVTPHGKCAQGSESVRQIYDVLMRFVPAEGVYLRPNHMRFWGTAKGTVTDWHYDGNGIHVLNLHVLGRKRWQLVSPENPLPPFPLNYTCRQMSRPLSESQKETLAWAECECGPGDLLFLPRLWAHSVTSLDAWNANVNTIFTPLDMATSKAAEREYARIVFLKLLAGMGLSKTTMHRREAEYHARFYERSVKSLGAAKLIRILAEELRPVPAGVVRFALRRYAAKRAPRTRTA